MEDSHRKKTPQKQKQPSTQTANVIQSNQSKQSSEHSTPQSSTSSTPSQSAKNLFSSLSSPTPISSATKDVESKEQKTKDKKEQEKEDNSDKVVYDPALKLQFVRHKVVATDDLYALAVQHGTSVESIRQFNRRVIFDYLDNVLNEWLLIPTTAATANVAGAASVSPAPSSVAHVDTAALQKKLLEDAETNRRFLLIRQLIEQAGPLQMDEREAIFYLSESNNSVSDAFIAWSEDKDWEKKEVERKKKEEQKKKSDVEKPKKIMMTANETENEADMDDDIPLLTEPIAAQTLRQRRLRKNVQLQQMVSVRSIDGIMAKSS